MILLLNQTAKFIRRFDPGFMKRFKDDDPRIFSVCSIDGIMYLLYVEERDLIEKKVKEIVFDRKEEEDAA